MCSRDGELSRLGHHVRLIPPQYVKPYVKRNKTDAADAEAICEAVDRPNMRFVPIKSIEQQSILALHRVRALLVRQRTSAVNAMRALSSPICMRITCSIHLCITTIPVMLPRGRGRDKQFNIEK